MTDDLAKAASAMGKKGGSKTALLGHDYFSQIGKMGGKKRWEKRKESKLQKDVGNVNKDEVVNVSS